MKILIVGGNGTIGRAVSDFFRQNHEVLVAGRSTGDVQVDMTDIESILSMYESTGKLDAVICIAGEAKWAPFDALTEADFEIGLRSKLMGQVNLVRVGRNFLNAGGSFTLTTGILADDPVPMTTSAAMVNGAIHSFVQAAALEMQNGHRINAVSSGLVDASAEKYKDYFPGHNPVPMWKTVNAYVKSVMGKGNGRVIRIYE
jgi:NAD(P)-dependent dehydrogenase (short-subunit alcohol dehydrogenase family)